MKDITGLLAVAASAYIFPLLLLWSRRVSAMDDHVRLRGMWLSTIAACGALVFFAAIVPIVRGDIIAALIAALSFAFGTWTADVSSRARRT
jgi:hypothetical protein